MKKWKIFVFISLGALLLVNGAFIFIENVYIKSDDKIVVKEINEESTLNTEEVEVNLEDGAENVQASNDGQYIAYNNGQIRIIDTKDDSVFNYEKVTDGEIVYFKWISDVKNLLVIEKIKEDGDYYLKPIKFNAKTKEPEALTDYDRNEIKLLINDDEIVENVIFATRSGYYYIQLKNKEGKSDLYTVNIMNQVKKVRENINIDNMVVTLTKTKPIMESNSKITVFDTEGYVDIPGVEEYKILGVDKNDKIYIGNEKEGKIIEMYSSEVNDDNSFSWNKIILDEPLSMEDIKVDYSGKVYLIYTDKDLIKEVTTGASIYCTDKILQSYSNGVIGIEDEKITKILIK